MWPTRKPKSSKRWHPAGLPRTPDNPPLWRVFFASLPLTAALVGGMQAELPATAALMLIGSHAGLAKTWWCKPLIEIALGLISFLLSRHWVYRR